MYFAVIFLVVTLITVTSGNPVYRKQFENIVNSNECLKSCMSNLTSFDEEISLMKNPNIQRYFGKIDSVCELISSTRKCIDDCGIDSNPFALESLNFACSTESKETIKKIQDCLTTKHADIYPTCAAYCGDYNAVFEEAHKMTQTIESSELNDSSKTNPIMEKTNQACGIYKCFAQCNVDSVKNECGKDLSTDLQSILQGLFDAQYKDLQMLNLVETMPKTVPPECNYMYDPNVIFSGASQGLEISKSQDNLFPKLQVELLLKQLKLIDRQNEMINRENQKLDLEMELLSQKMENRRPFYRRPY